MKISIPTNHVNKNCIEFIKGSLENINFKSEDSKKYHEKLIEFGYKSGYNQAIEDLSQLLSTMITGIQIQLETDLGKQLKQLKNDSTKT